MKRKITLNNRGPAFDAPLDVYTERRIEEFSREDAAVGTTLDAMDSTNTPSRETAGTSDTSGPGPSRE